MRDFAYLAVDRCEDAVASLGRFPSCRLLAGGTNLVDLIRERVEEPDVLVDITGIAGLDRIERLSDGTVRIGALARNADVAHDPLIIELFPMLSQALLAGASAQLRNMATVGGNLLQRCRCWYFVTAGYPCNKKVPGSGCAALGGFNREHAILGASEACVATHPSDMSVALAALGAEVVTMGPCGERRIPFRDFHLEPGETPERETSLRGDELIVAVEIASTPVARLSGYVKLRDRSSYQFALASAAAALAVEDGRIVEARLALGGIATRPWRAGAAERQLVGMVADEDAFRAAAATALKDARPLRHNAFKIELAKGAIIRALLDLSERP